MFVRPNGGRYQLSNTCIVEYCNLEELERNQASRAGLPRNDTSPPFVRDPPLYRGHSNPCWKLETTLERQHGSMSVRTYYHHISQCQSEISSAFNQNWEVKNLVETRNRYRDCSPHSIAFPELLGEDYLTYLRHYGFPSPLLDWTRSLFVAAFFAYRSQPPEKQKHVGIYVLDNVSPDAINDEPNTQNSIQFKEIDRFIKTDRRHFLQKSTYTVCLRAAENEIRFGSHEDFFASRKGQNLILKKYLLPVSERKHILTKLDSMTLNAFSLFGSVESLMETMSNREFNS
jgi:hypothetical protein